MSKSEARRQKQLAKKKGKRDAKRLEIARQHSDNPLIRLEGAEAWPILAAWAPVEIAETRMGVVLLARHARDGKIALASFLVDPYCLGVKDADWNIISEWEYDRTLRKNQSVQALHKVAPEFLAKLVYGAVDYAQSIGFAPHPDYHHAKMLLAGIDPSICMETFTFGHDGKPLYINGPNDSLDRMKVIMHKVRLAGGHVAIGQGGGRMSPLANDDGASEDEPSGAEILQS